MWLCDEIANGATVQNVADALDTTRPMIYGYLRSLPDGMTRLSHARESLASTLAEETLDIADNATPETERVDKLRIDTRKWLAGSYNRAAYGESKQSVTVDVRVLHLEALRDLRSVAQLDSSLVSRHPDTPTPLLSEAGSAALGVSAGAEPPRQSEPGASPATGSPTPTGYPEKILDAEFVEITPPAPEETEPAVAPSINPWTPN